MERNTISNILHIIAEHIINRENWILGDNFNDLVTNISDDQHRHLITIDNVFAVCITMILIQGVHPVHVAN